MWTARWTPSPAWWTWTSAPSPRCTTARWMPNASTCSARSPASACRATETDFRRTRTGRDATASPARRTTATAAECARLRTRRRFASKCRNSYFYSRGLSSFVAVFQVMFLCIFLIYVSSISYMFEDKFLGAYNGVCSKLWYKYRITLLGALLETQGTYKFIHPVF